jgi:hypothetical protein
MSDHQEPAEQAPHAPIIDHEPLPHAADPAQHSEAISEPPPEPPPAPQAVAEPPPAPVVVKRGGTPFLLTLLLTAGLGGGLYYVWSHPQPSAGAADPQPAIDAAKKDFSAQIQALADRVDRLEKQPAPTAQPASPDAVTDLSKRLDDISGHLNGLATRQDQLAAEIQKTQEIAAQKPADITTPPPDHTPPDHPSPDPAAVQAQQQLADLGTKLDQALAQEKTSLDTLDQRLGKLEQSPPPPPAAPPDTSAIAALEARVKQLEQGAGQIEGAKQDATLAVKLEAAQAALTAGEPLGDIPGAPPALARFATTAPPTETSLKTAFAKAAPSILAASRPEDAQKSFFSRALARLEQSVTVRNGDHVIVGDPAAGVVERARERLDNSDIKGAVTALSGLSGAAADAAKDWVAQAQALLDARAALATLAAHG